MPPTLESVADASLWPVVDDVVRSHGLAGLAVGVVQDGATVLGRAFGVRDVATGEPVTLETMFHLASVSKPFVATAVALLASQRPGGEGPVLDLDGPVLRWLPDLRLADGRAGEITVRHLLSHTSGIPDVTDYGWHAPQLDDGALHRFVLGLAGSRLEADPGTRFSYCNAGFEMLGDLLAAVTGETFETAVKRLVLDPAGMTRSTFRRADVPSDLAASPHVGAPLQVAPVYPYTRAHAPSSSLHSNVRELSRWMLAHLDATGRRLDGRVRDLLWRPTARCDFPPWEEEVGLGWFLGTYRGHRVVDHSGADPGFGSKLVLVPGQRTGVVVLANSNTAPIDAVVRAVLDVVLRDRPAAEPAPAPGSAPDAAPSRDPGPSALGELLPPVVGALASALAGPGGRAAAVETYRRLAAAEPAVVDLDDARVEDAVWGAVELHHPDLVRPLLRLWTTVRPESSPAWTMTGWADAVDGHLDRAAETLRGALALDRDNHDAALLLRTLPRAAAD